MGSTAGEDSELLGPECAHKPGDYTHLAALVERIKQNKVKLEKIYAKVNFACSRVY